MAAKHNEQAAAAAAAASSQANDVKPTVDTVDANGEHHALVTFYFIGIMFILEVRPKIFCEI